MPPRSAASGCWRCGTRSPSVEKRTKVGDRDALIDQLWAAIQALPDPDQQPDAKPPSKQDAVIAMLQRPEGATVDEIASAMGWQRHTVRGLFSGTLKKKLGLSLASTTEERGQVSHRRAGAGMNRALQDGTACREALARLSDSILANFVSSGALSTKPMRRRISAASCWCELSLTGCRKSLLAGCARGGCASSANLHSSLTKPESRGTCSAGTEARNPADSGMAGSHL